MLRYRIARGADGHYLVLPALISLLPISETYATRADAQETANWLNRLRGDELPAERGHVPGACPEVMHAGA